jgi:hypothetical protein
MVANPETAQPQVVVAAGRPAYRTYHPTPERAVPRRTAREPGVMRVLPGWFH